MTSNQISIFDYLPSTYNIEDILGLQSNGINIQKDAEYLPNLYSRTSIPGVVLQRNPINTLQKELCIARKLPTSGLNFTD